MTQPVELGRRWVRRPTVNAQRAVKIAVRDGGWNCAYCAARLARTDNGEGHVWRDSRGEPFLNCPDGSHAYGLCHHDGWWTIEPEYTTAVIEHVVPRARGGLNNLDNLRLSCNWCNSRKGAKLLSELSADWWHANPRFNRKPELLAAAQVLVASREALRAPDTAATPAEAWASVSVDQRTAVRVCAPELAAALDTLTLS